MPQPTSEEELHDVLTGVHPGLAKFRRRLRRVPASPRCKLCAAPFDGVGGAVLRHFGFGRFEGNPAICQMCIGQFGSKGWTGAEIPVSLLFADIRGSTTIAERMRPTEFHAFLDRFYRLASDIILRDDGLVDKLVGDEIIGLFFGGVSGPDHAGAAITAAIDLATAVQEADGARGPIPLGVAVHTGDAYVGTTAPHGVINDFTALGDVVNTTARLASAAAAGEIVLSLDAATAAGRDTTKDEHRTLEVRGREQTIEVVVLKIGSARSPVAGRG